MIDENEMRGERQLFGMADGDDFMRFLNVYQNIIFKESGFNHFETASIRRKCLALAFQTSLKWSKDELSFAVLDEKTKAYTSSVEKINSGNVDNYYSSSLALSANCNTECFQWKSSLDDPILIPEGLKSKLECDCQKVTWNNVKQLSDSIKINASNDNGKQLKSTFEMVPNFNLGEDFICEGKLTTTDGALMSTYSNVSPKRKQHSLYKQSGSNFSGTKFLNSNTSQDFGDSKQQSAVSWSNPIEVKVTRTENRDSTNTDCARRNNSAPFKTAREELGIQNQKKWRQGGQNNTNVNSSRFPSKIQKRLGTSRRPAVNDEFVLPVHQEPRQEQSEFCEMEEDERLKGIDPKMIEMIKNEIIDSGKPVNWDDIAGLDFAKATIQEIVVWPLLRPDIFFGLRGPPKGLLLFGPPGTGKTLIGKCIASQSKSTFFSISASSLTSKWIGEGEKMVRALFAVARCHPPAVIFIDEIDSLLSQRNETDHESSRRIKTEFLVQLDGAATSDEERILVIGATNRPQELDEAARRRLVKRLYIPLPEFKARRQIIVKLMSDQRNNLSSEEIDEIAKLAEGYSGADMKNLCREAALGPIRSIKLEDMEHILPNQVRPVIKSDFIAALSQVRASVSGKDLDQYITWNEQYGCVEAK